MLAKNLIIFSFLFFLTLLACHFTAKTQSLKQRILKIMAIQILIISVIMLNWLMFNVNWNTEELNITLNSMAEINQKWAAIYPLILNKTVAWLGFVAILLAVIVYQLLIHPTYLQKLKVHSTKNIIIILSACFFALLSWLCVSIEPVERGFIIRYNQWEIIQQRWQILTNFLQPLRQPH